MTRIFNSPNEALCYMVECTMATLEGLRSVKKTSKYEISRHEQLVEIGLRNCEVFKLRDAAHTARCSRVELALDAREKARQEPVG